MRRALVLAVIGMIANGGAALGAFAQTTFIKTPEVTLTRLDCGTGVTPIDPAHYNDTFAFPDLKFTLTFSCYLIRHGADYMIWDTGFAPGTSQNAPKVSIPDQLKRLNLSADQITVVGISHYHRDHIGQVGAFPKALLLIGQKDWEALNAAKPGPDVNPAPFAHWISGGGKVEPVVLDKDVFGDGTVLILGTPGHTPGHQSLLVRLKQTGVVMLSGDIAHFRENYDAAGVPPFNTDRAQTLASIDRFKTIAARFKAMVIIQHDPRDIDKLPPFPAAAR